MGPTHERVGVRLEAIHAPVTEAMARSEAFLRRTLASDSAYIQTLCRHTERFKGKRMRPTLLHLAARTLDPDRDGTASETHVQVAAVIELIHLTTLVHDDIIDEAAVRRRVPTVNTAWGNETAVILGDYLFAGAFKILTSLQDLRPLAILAATTKLMCEGELLQIGHRGDVHITEEEYRDVIGKKTAALFHAAAYLGALLAGADTEQAESLGAFGRHIGLAFQMIDDCLDLVGTEKATGKSLGTDIEKGRLTLPAIHWAGRVPPSQRERAVRDLGILDEPVDRTAVAARLREAGSLAYTSASARREVEKARALLAPLPASAAREALEALGEYVLSRSV